MSKANIVSENKKRKERHQRTIWIMSKSEYTCFEAFLMSVSVQNEQGEHIWLEISAKERKKGLCKSNYLG